MKTKIVTTDVPNKNNRIYSTKVFQKAINRAETMIESKRMFLLNTLPESDYVDVSHAIGVVNNISIRCNEVMAEVELFEQYKSYEPLIKDGIMHVRTSGTATTTHQDDGTIIVNDDFKLLCCTVVLHPA